MKYLVLGTQEGRLDYHDQGCSLQPFRDPLHGKELLGSLIRLTGAGPGEGRRGERVCHSSECRKMQPKQDADNWEQKQSRRNIIGNLTITRREILGVLQ